MTTTDTDAPTEADYLDAIAAAHDRLLEADRALREAVRSARHRRPQPVPWEKIGAILGITRQGAEYRFRGRRR